MGAGRKAAQAATVVKGTAPDDPQAPGQDQLLQKAAAKGMESFFPAPGGSRGVSVPEVQIIPGMRSTRQIASKGPQEACGAIRLHRIAAELFRRRQTAGLLGEAVIPQLGDGQRAPLRGGQSLRQGDAGLVPIHADEAGRIVFERQNIQKHKKTLSQQKTAAQSRRAAVQIKALFLHGLCKAGIHSGQHRVAGITL